MSSRKSLLAEALAAVECFSPGDDGLSGKSRELVLGLLKHSEEPFSRSQFQPGHITCTALVHHPVENQVLFVFHHRLERWLLPGGHVEHEDDSLAAAAAREAREETMVEIDANTAPVLAGIDVHGIPPKKGEPFHLHHDLIWAFRTLSPEIAITDEAPMVVWAGAGDHDRLDVADSIRNAIRRVLRY